MNHADSIVQTYNIKVGVMRLMFALTAVMTLPAGLLMMLAPEVLTNTFGWVLDEPLFPGAYGGCLLAFGVLCILGFRSPVKYAPVLFFQFTYKTAWILMVWLPLWIRGELPEYHLIYTAMMVFAAAVDLYAVPFRYLFKKES